MKINLDNPVFSYLQGKQQVAGSLFGGTIGGLAGINRWAKEMSSPNLTEEQRKDKMFKLKSFIKNVGGGTALGTGAGYGWARVFGPDLLSNNKHLADIPAAWKRTKDAIRKSVEADKNIKETVEDLLRKQQGNTPKQEQKLLPYFPKTSASFNFKPLKDISLEDAIRKLQTNIETLRKMHPGGNPKVESIYNKLINASQKKFHGPGAFVGGLIGQGVGSDIGAGIEGKSKMDPTRKGGLIGGFAGMTAGAIGGGLGSKYLAIKRIKELALADKNLNNVLRDAADVYRNKLRSELGTPVESWLGLNKNMTKKDVDARLRYLKTTFHPDRGGNADYFNQVKQYENQLKNDSWYKNLK